MPQLIVKIPPFPGTTYSIKVRAGLLQTLTWLPKNLAGHSMVVITDNTVKTLHAKRFIDALKAQGYSPLLLSFPPGEKSKTAAVKQRLENLMMQHRYGRNTLCIALGGGIVGDLAGYLAATYMRGIPYIQVPTTLLSMVDSSIGGKTGINTAYGKNLIGAFWQPKAVIADIDCLSTLPKRQIINGLIEALKMFLTHDAKSFFYVQKQLPKVLHGDKNVLTHIIYRSIKIKARVVQADEKEQNQRMTLNFGHTMGHALEKVSHYRLLHGFAVGFGILIEAKISQYLGLLQANDYAIIESVFSQLGITAKGLKKLNVDAVIQATKIDKKVKQGVVHYVLLKKPGTVHRIRKQFAHKVSDSLVKKAFLAATASG